MRQGRQQERTQRHRLYYQWKWFLYHCSTKWRERCFLSVRGRPRHTGERRKTCCKKLAKVVRSRFSVKLSENKLKEKLDSHLIPENCTEISVPVLNVEIVEKGILDRMAKKNDARLPNVQKLITIATAHSRFVQRVWPATPRDHGARWPIYARRRAAEHYALRRNSQWDASIKRWRYCSARHGSTRTVHSQTIPAATRTTKRHGIVV